MRRHAKRCNVVESLFHSTCGPAMNKTKNNLRVIQFITSLTSVFLQISLQTQSSSPSSPPFFSRPSLTTFSSAAWTRQQKLLTKRLSEKLKNIDLIPLRPFYVSTFNTWEKDAVATGGRWYLLSFCFGPLMGDEMLILCSYRSLPATGMWSTGAAQRGHEERTCSKRS